MSHSTDNSAYIKFYLIVMDFPKSDNTTRKTIMQILFIIMNYLSFYSTISVGDNFR